MFLDLYYSGDMSYNLVLIRKYARVDMLTPDLTTEHCRAEDRETYPDFLTMPLRLTNVPKLRARYTKLCAAWSAGHVSISDAHALFHDAKTEDAKIAPWLYQKQHRMPYMSYPLPMSEQLSSSEVYPCRIDKYRQRAHAAQSNGWRLSRVIVLALIAQVARFLALNTSLLEEANQLWTTQKKAENKIQELVDDLCASIPFIISSKNTEEVLLHYPHAPGHASFMHISEPDLLAGMSQLLPSLIIGSQVYCIPESQKQWLQEYLTMVSRNPKEDKEKAMKLRLADGLGTSGRIPSSVNEFCVL